VSLFASGFRDPRWLATAPNGDVFVADSAAGQVLALHDHQSGNQDRQVFAEGLKLPFGIAFHDRYVYVAETDGVVRFSYDPQTSQRTSAAERILDLPGMGYNQHWTRSIAFSADATRLFVSIGSETNESIETDPRRAAILASDPNGGGARVYASGLRNAVGLGINPWSGRLWASVNERDNLGDDVPEDYFTRVVEGGFYGWPYSYKAAGETRVDNRVSPRPDLTAIMVSPDMPLGAHVAPLQFAFRRTLQFPPQFSEGVFLAEHGSWNRRTRSGYQVAFLPFRDGAPDGPPRPFLTGFITDPAGTTVFGRPVGVAALGDGSLLVSDDGANVIWKVSYGSAPN
jgi:glucose/arabinose dehydrogenase